jgi:hypothetical protein
MPTYTYRECSGYDEDFEAAGDDAARAHAEELLSTGDWDVSDGTIWVTATVTRAGQDEDGYEYPGTEVRVQLDQPAPECPAGEHDWQQPSALVGGGVRGNAGGVIISEACVRCGAGRETDTWHQMPDNGVVAPDSVVTYRGPGHYDLSLLEDVDA